MTAGTSLYQLLADAVLVAHFLFIAFALAGGLMLLRWPRMVWLHLPATMWTVYIELTGGVCPLTPLENYFRALAGADVYQGDFIERYLLPLIYPAALTSRMQMVFAAVVLVINLLVYAWAIRAHRKTP